MLPRTTTMYAGYVRGGLLDCAIDPVQGCWGGAAEFRLAPLVREVAAAWVLLVPRSGLNATMSILRSRR